MHESDSYIALVLLHFNEGTSRVRTHAVAITNIDTDPETFQDISEKINWIVFLISNQGLEIHRDIQWWTL